MVRAVKSITHGSDDEAKERLLAILKKLKDSEAHGAQNDKNPDNYDARQIAELKNALEVRCTGLGWNEDAQTIYGKLATNCPQR